MNTLYKFQQAIKYNKTHQVFTPFDDADLGLRRPGYFEKEFMDNDHKCQSYIFDNGEHFIYDETLEALYYEDPIPQNLFLHKYLERAVYDFIRAHQLKDDNDHLLPIHCATNEIEVKSLIRLLPYENEKTVYLTNIILPAHLRNHGHGLKLISYLYQICDALGYHFVITEMTETFYKRMLRREAKSRDIDAVEISAETNLGKIQNSHSNTHLNKK